MARPSKSKVLEQYCGAAFDYDSIAKVTAPQLLNQISVYHRLTAAQLGGVFGVSRSRMSEYLNGHRPLPKALLTKLASIFYIPPEIIVAVMINAESDDNA